MVPALPCSHCSSHLHSSVGGYNHYPADPVFEPARVTSFGHADATREEMCCIGLPVDLAKQCADLVSSMEAPPEPRRDDQQYVDRECHGWGRVTAEM